MIYTRMCGMWFLQITSSLHASHLEGRVFDNTVLRKFWRKERL